MKFAKSGEFSEKTLRSNAAGFRSEHDLLVGHYAEGREINFNLLAQYRIKMIYYDTILMGAPRDLQGWDSQRCNILEAALGMELDRWSQAIVNRVK